jgi:acetylornithine aminotransferase
VIDEAAVMPTYARYPVTLVRGEGLRVWDDAGRSYLDLIGGLGALSLGHCHPAWVEAVERAVRTIGMTSNLVATVPQADLDRLATAPARSRTRVFFCNPGRRRTRRCEVVRKHGLRQDAHDRPLDGSFHGRTVATWRPRAGPATAPFEPLVDWFVVPPGERRSTGPRARDVGAAVSGATSARERGPAQHRLPARRPRSVRRGRRAAGVESQAGAGRVGEGWHRWPGRPADVASLAGARRGLPSAPSSRAKSRSSRAEHASTFGGGPVPCEALSVLDVIERDDSSRRRPARPAPRGRRPAPRGSLRRSRPRPADGWVPRVSTRSSSTAARAKMASTAGPASFIHSAATVDAGGSTWRPRRWLRRSEAAA